MKACIVGAGIVGLTTAMELKREFRDVDITVLADKFTVDTTSDGAAGLFWPYLNFCGPTEAITNKWFQDAYVFYQGLMEENCGIYPIAGFQLSNSDPTQVENSIMKHISSDYHPATQADLSHLSTSFTYGHYASTMVIACRKFLPWSMERLKRSGVRFKRQTIDNFFSLPEHYDVVFNCTGLASKYLCNDTNVMPVRGQVVQVRAPWVKHYYMVNDSKNYIIPCGYDGVVTLGGTQDNDCYDTTVSQNTANSIWNECCKLLPNLRHASKVRDWVGLRPYRKMTRVEIEKRKPFLLIHNYGHGGSGVTVAPGTSKYAVELFRENQYSGAVLKL